MARHLGAHLCRCTGYVKVLDAIEAVAKGTPVDPHAARRHRHERRQVRGGRAARSATAATSTTSACPACSTPRCTSPRTPAPTSSRIDTTTAEAAPGVVAVFTAADIPGEQYVGIIYKDWPVFIGEGQRTQLRRRRAGHRRRRHQAARPRRRRKLVDVDVRRAAARSPIPWPPSTIPRSPCTARRTTCCRVSAYARGDVDAALGQAAHTVHEVFQTQRIEHAFLEPESTLAVPADDGDAARVLRRPGRVGRPRPDRLAARRRQRRRSPWSWCPTAARSAARRT